MKILSNIYLIKNRPFNAVYLAILLAFASCTSTPEKVASNTEKDIFCIPKQLQPIMAVDTVTQELVMHELLLTGKIGFDEERVIKVFPLAGGIVQRVEVQLGDYVEKGKILAVLSSSDIADLERDFSAAESNLSIADKNLAAAEEMFKSGLTTERDFNVSQKEKIKAKSEVARINELLRIYSGSGKSDYIVRAPMSGFIMEKKVNTNMQIRTDNSDNLFTISDVKQVWVIANVYESDIAKVKLGYEAVVTTIAYPGVEYKGKVDKIYNVLDAENKVMKVRIQLQNDGYLLKPEMFANVRIVYTENKSMTTVPSRSVIFEHSKNYVVVYKDLCHVAVQEISIYHTYNDKTYIYEAYPKAGDRVISRSQLLIYNALTQ